MNMGVSTTPCAVCNRPRRARVAGSLVRSSNFISVILRQTHKCPIHTRQSTSLMSVCLTQNYRITAGGKQRRDLSRSFVKVVLQFCTGQRQLDIEDEIGSP